MEKRAVIYARVSTDEQAENGNSLQSQIEICTNYANVNGLQVIGEIQDDYSGMKYKRPGLQVILQMVEKAEVDAIVVKSSDRWSRRLVNTSILRDKLNRYGVELHYAQRGRVQNTPEHRVVDNVEGSFNEYWRDKIIENTTRGKRDKARIKGLYVQGPGPYGYRIDRTAPGGLAINEDQAEVVRLIFSLYNSGYSLQQVAHELRRRNIEPPKGGNSYLSGLYRLYLLQRGNMHRQRGRQLHPRNSPGR
jgi:site-specific DNA recombinase